MAIDESWKLVVERLAHYSAPGEFLIDTLDRLLKDRELQIYGMGAIRHARDEAKVLRIAFACAILSQPNKELRISRMAQDALDGPGGARDLVITEHHDLATGEGIYKVFDRRTRNGEDGARTESRGTGSGSGEAPGGGG